MSNPPTTATINYIVTTTTESLLTDNNKIDTSGKVQERINAAISEITDDYVELNPSGPQTILNKQSLTSTGDLIIGATTSGDNANLTVNGNATTSGTMTSGGKLTVSSGGAEVTAGGVTVTAGGVSVTSGGLTVSSDGMNVTGNSSVTGTLNASGNTTVGSSATSANLTVHGDVGCTTLTLPVYTPSP